MVSQALTLPLLLSAWRLQASIHAYWNLTKPLLQGLHCITQRDCDSNDRLEGWLLSQSCNLIIGYCWALNFFFFWVYSLTSIHQSISFAFKTIFLHSFEHGLLPPSLLLWHCLCGFRATLLHPWGFPRHGEKCYIWSGSQDPDLEWEAFLSTRWLWCHFIFEMLVGFTRSAYLFLSLNHSIVQTWGLFPYVCSSDELSMSSLLNWILDYSCSLIGGWTVSG